MALPPADGYSEEHDLDGEIDYSDIEQKWVGNAIMLLRAVEDIQD